MAAAYYGNISRKLFIAGGAITILFGPAYPEIFPLGAPFIAVTVMLTLGLLASLTNPKQYGIIVADTVASGLIFLLFAHKAYDTYQEADKMTMSVIVSQALALIFFPAFYYSSRTVRAHYLEREQPQQP